MTAQQNVLHDEKDWIPCPLRKAAEEVPEAPALIGARAPLSYEALERRVASVAAEIGARGLEEGARVALYLPRGIDYVVLLLALWRQGAVAAPLSTRTPPEALAPLLDALGRAHLIAAPGAAGPASPPGAAVYDAGVLLAGEASGAGRSSAPAWPLEQAATAVFTSGSTGRPKAALHTLENHYYSAKGSNQNLPLGPGDRWLLSLPLYHVGGLAIIFRCLLARAAAVVPDRSLSLAEAVRRYRISHLSLVATQLRRLLKREAPPPASLRAVLVGGSALPPALVEAAHGAGWPLFTTYGLTEMASQVTTTRPGAPLEELQTAGALLPYRELRLAGDGEILVKGRTRFTGYLQDGALERPFDAQGWFATGDRGRLASAGLLHVSGRMDNLLISGGENIQPEEIERALQRLGDVERAVVVPVPDAEFGERPVAFVQGAALEELADRLHGRLPRFKIPDAFYPWPSDYAAAGMKLDRSFFRERARRLHAEKTEHTRT